MQRNGGICKYENRDKSIFKLYVIMIYVKRVSDMHTRPKYMDGAMW